MVVARDDMGGPGMVTFWVLNQFVWVYFVGRDACFENPHRLPSMSLSG